MCLVVNEDRRWGVKVGYGEDKHFGQPQRAGRKWKAQLPWTHGVPDGLPEKDFRGARVISVGQRAGAQLEAFASISSARAHHGRNQRSTGSLARPPPPPPQHLLEVARSREAQGGRISIPQLNIERQFG